MPGKVYVEKMFDNNLPPGTKISCSETGYSSDEIAMLWLEHFDEQTRGKQQGQYRLLIFDGHGSHMTYQFISKREQLKIIPFCLIAHSTTLLNHLMFLVFSQKSIGMDEQLKIEFVLAVMPLQNISSFNALLRSEPRPSRKRRFSLLLDVPAYGH